MRTLRHAATVVAGLCALKLWAAAPAATPPTPASDEVVELPPLEVQGAGTVAPPWRYASVPGVEVLSRCSDSATRGMVEANDRLEQILRTILPADFQPRYDSPKIMILDEPSVSKNSAEAVVMDHNARAPGQVTPRIRFLPNLRLHDTDDFVVYAIVNAMRSDPEQLTLTVDHVQSLLNRRVPQLPAWFIEGFMAVYRDLNFTADGDRMRLSAADWTSPAASDQFRKDPLRPRVFLPMGALFAPIRAVTGEQRDLWRAQAGLFVRWALFANGGSRREALYRLLRRLDTEPMSEPLLEECFGLNYADVRDRLSDYVPTAVAEQLKLDIPKLQPTPKFRPRLATPGEIARLKGEWERLEIAYVRVRQPKWVQRYADHAYKTLTQAYERGERDARLLAVIGLYECDVGNDEGARPFLEEAARQRVTRPRVYVELARLRYADAMRSADPAGKFLAAPQVANVVEPLRTAWMHFPPVPQSYLIATEAWCRAEYRLPERDLAQVREGVRLHWSNVPVLYGAVRLYLLQGNIEEARRVYRRAVELAPPEPWRQRVEQLGKYVPPES